MLMEGVNFRERSQKAQMSSALRRDSNFKAINIMKDKLWPNNLYKTIFKEGYVILQNLVGKNPNYPHMFRRARLISLVIFHNIIKIKLGQA